MFSKVEENANMMVREMENIKKTQIEILQTKNTASEMKDTGWNYQQFGDYRRKY